MYSQVDVILTLVKVLGGCKMEKEMVRINTRVSSEANDWLDKRSVKTGMSKSALVMLAVETYKQQVQTMESMGNMTEIYNKLEEIAKQLKEK